MLVALNKQGELCYANQIKEGYKIEQLYLCPKCHQPLIIKKSHKNNYYFSHKNKCFSNKEKSSYLESDAHKNFKKFMVDYFASLNINVCSEKYLVANDQFADVFLSLFNDNWIIEYQQSVISSEILSERHRDYCKCFTNIIWVIHEGKIDKKWDTSWGKNFIYYHQNLGYYIISWCPIQNKLWLRSHLPILYNNKSHPKESIEPFYLLNLKKIIPKQQNNSKYIHKTSSTYQKRLSQIYHSKSNRKYILNLYKNKLTVNELPQWMIFEDWQNLVFEEPTWYIFALILIFFKNNILLSFNKYQFIQTMVKEIEQVELTWINFPFILEKNSEIFWTEVLELFVERNLIIYNPNINKYYWNQV